MLDRFTLLNPRWLHALAERLRGPTSGDCQDRVSLPGGGLWSRRLRGPSRLLVCEAGQVWLTLEGDPRDHVLGAGDTLKVPAGHVVVQALRAAHFNLSGCRSGLARDAGTPSPKAWVDSPRGLDYLRR
ncbi:DUF2917 domain-containing protein [Corallococcus carmarthensis]|uniref:DUF2917 domain-containing protein n=1 Tax=Corallococcus carmarthensis TaxID=2316728 RepID=A0A3A8K9X0_9BACT|nr:DUF2917 domain-containing protein [Corallococcus carmarthensis]RKH04127.1 DUF2917 domain-containing protein [Corallococcus carmarthensis]